MPSNLENRIIKLEKVSVGKDQIYVVFVDPPVGVAIDNAHVIT